MNFGDPKLVTGRETHTVFYCSHKCGWRSVAYRHAPAFRAVCPDCEARGKYSAMNFVKFSMDELAQAEAIVGAPVTIEAEPAAE